MIKILIRRKQRVLIGQVAGHKRQTDPQRYGYGVVAVLKGVGDLAQNEVLFVFEAGPVKHLFFFRDRYLVI